jgi:hypothetical protein
MMRQFQTTNDPANCNNNGVCEVGEDCQSCADCGYPADELAQPVSGALCGNGLCEAGDDENCVTCPVDCAGKQKGSASKQFCCGFDDGQVNNPIVCGDFENVVNDDRCIDSGTELFCRVEPRLSACCGDTLCEGAETEQSCALDCAATPPVCTPTEDPEVSCFDGLDNDCDADVDCADVNCDGAVGPATNCGTGECASTGNLTCSGGVEVDTCTPGTPGVEGPFGDPTCNDTLDNDCDGLTDAEDPDCQQAMQCADYQDRVSCRNAGCKWKQNRCQDP